MSSRKASRVAFTYAVVTAVVATSIGLYILTSNIPRSEGLLLLIGCLLVVWAIVFSFLEVGRIAAHSKKITGPDELVDPDAPRRVIVEPPTGEPYPHHEAHTGSGGRDQGQLTSSLPDHTPSIRKLLRRGNPRSQ